MGYELPASGLDHGIPGAYNASHAEKQMAVERPGELIAVSSAMCMSYGRGDCIPWFRALLRYEQTSQIVADPNTIRVFWPDGTITEFPR
jgi:hypothetical protein